MWTGYDYSICDNKMAVQWLTKVMKGWNTKWTVHWWHTLNFNILLVSRLCVHRNYIELVSVWWRRKWWRNFTNFPQSISVQFFSVQVISKARYFVESGLDIRLWEVHQRSNTDPLITLCDHWYSCSSSIPVTLYINILNSVTHRCINTYYHQYHQGSSICTPNVVHLYILWTFPRVSVYNSLWSHKYK